MATFFIDCIVGFRLTIYIHNLTCCFITLNIKFFEVLLSIHKEGFVEYLVYEVGLNFIDCTVDVVYDPADIEELTIQYEGHAP